MAVIRCSDEYPEISGVNCKEALANCPMKAKSFIKKNMTMQ